MVMSLRRVVLGTRALPFCTSPPPLQLHTPFLEARHTLNSFWTSSFARFFSADHTNSNLSESISEAQEQDDAAKRATAAARRTRYEHLKRRFAENPELLRKYREKYRRFNDTSRQPRDRTYDYVAAKKERERKKIDSAYALYRAIPLWIMRHQWVRDSLPWKTHVPLYHSEKVEHECTKCLITRHGGAKLWWKKRAAPDQDDHEYECNHCYMTGLDKLPEGYEDITDVSYTALKARKIELDGPDSVPEPKLRKRKTAKP